MVKGGLGARGVVMKGVDGGAGFGPGLGYAMRTWGWHREGGGGICQIRVDVGAILGADDAGYTVEISLSLMERSSSLVMDGLALVVEL